MLLTGLSNDRDRGGRTAMVEFTNDGSDVATHWMPTDADLRGAVKSGQFADAYGCDQEGRYLGTMPQLLRIGSSKRFKAPLQRRLLRRTGLVSARTAPARSGH